MKIVGLVENTSCSKIYESKHGLCLYIETQNHKILFDLGPDDTFIRNAKKLGIDIEAIDTVILSHGHKDHGGGLEAFLIKNKHAKVYVQESAFVKHSISVLGVQVNVALNPSLKYHPQVRLLQGNYKIDEELLLFTTPKFKEFMPEGNKKLYKREGKTYSLDDFDHEQNLILSVEGKRVLLAGCAHRGITNIVEEAEKIAQNALDVVIGGFHLVNPASLMKKPSPLTEVIGMALYEKGYQYYTCHCTGEVAYLQLQEILGEQIRYLQTGVSVEL